MGMSGTREGSITVHGGCERVTFFQNVDGMTEHKSESIKESTHHKEL